jgi:hypothetical protein
VEDAALGVLRTHTSGASFSTGHLGVRHGQGLGGCGGGGESHRRYRCTRYGRLCCPGFPRYNFLVFLRSRSARRANSQQTNKKDFAGQANKKKENSRRRSFVKRPPQAEAELLDRRVSGRRAPERPELSPPAVEHFAPVVVARGGGGGYKRVGINLIFSVRGEKKRR